MAHYDIVGLFGVLIILFEYYSLQAEKRKSHELRYSVMNFLGSSMILYSLYYTWNLASVIIEIAWFIISLYGIIKYFRKKKITT